MGDSQSKQFGTQYLDKLGDQLDKKAPVFNQSLFAGAGDATKNAWSQGTTFGNSLVGSNGYGAGQQAAQNSLGGVFSGYGAVADNNGLTGAQANAMTGNAGLGSQYAGLSSAYDENAPGYARMRQKLLDDASTSTAALFGNSGRLGSGASVDNITEASLNAIAPLDYSNYQNNINNQYRSLDSQRGIYGDTFNMGQTGVGNTLAGLGGQAATAGAQFGMGQTALTNKQGALDLLTQIGSAKDANAQGALLGKADLFDRTKNAELDRLIKIGAAFGDPTAAANEPAWWQSLLGGALGLGGSALSGGAFR